MGFGRIGVRSLVRIRPDSRVVSSISGSSDTMDYSSEYLACSFLMNSNWCSITADFNSSWLVMSRSFFLRYFSSSIFEWRAAFWLDSSIFFEICFSLFFIARLTLRVEDFSWVSSMVLSYNLSSRAWMFSISDPCLTFILKLSHSCV